MSDDEKPAAPDELALIAEAFAQYGVRVKSPSEGVKAVLAQLQQTQATCARLRLSHKAYVGACTCQ